ncbi:hypothetical protein D9758_012813 [Tetrapyrgos nigripes]|uniref:Uncharacterized protein n=1 Tax=Tetrapyrgos nigripes TaxID=182062 RepID=A0A8H5FVB1_9AGAR|nr:hypothetical protein D9758_012813 [Tetrapyrgos nigripes]
MSLSQDDQQLLPVIGRSIYQNIEGVVVESATWGCYALLFVFAAHIQISNGLKPTRNKVLFGVTCLLFMTSTILLALNIAWSEMGVHDILMVNPEEALLDKVDAANSKLVALGTPMEGLFLLNVGDAVVIWRAYVIWNRRKLVILFPVLCLLLSLAFAISDMICLQASNSPDQTTIPTGGRVCTWSEPLAWALSLLTNISSTLLIAAQACRRTRRAMALLVESGLIYCIFWMSELIIFFDIPRSSKAFYAYQFFASIGDQISGMYPTAIIVIVAIQQSFGDTIASSRTSSVRFKFGTGSGADSHRSQNQGRSRLVFAAVPSETMTSAATDPTLSGFRGGTDLNDHDHELVVLDKSSTDLEKGDDIVELVA